MKKYKALFVGVPLNEGYIPAFATAKCNKCGIDISITKASFSRFKKCNIVSCVDCIPKNYKILNPSKGQIQEIIKYIEKV